MTFSQPLGYRLPSHISLTSLNRALERFGWPVWRVEVVRAVAAVVVEMMAPSANIEEVCRRLSNGQVGAGDLVISRTQNSGVLLRSAEFLDVAHGLLHRPSAVPLPPKLDLRCRAQFMDDTGDPDRAWTYVLFGTEHDRLEQMFLHLRGCESYPLATIDDPPTTDIEDQGWEERVAVWQRVLAPFSRSTPLQVSAPEPQVMFELFESLQHPDSDAELAAAGKVTLSAVIDEIVRRLAGNAPDDLRELLTAPTNSSTR